MKFFRFILLFFNFLSLISQSVEQKQFHETESPQFGLNDQNDPVEEIFEEEILVLDSIQITDWENKASVVIENAKRFLNTPHKIGGYDERGIDCSGLTKNAFSSLEISLPRTSYEQAGIGIEVPKSEIRKGDLVFFKIWKNRISHVGIAIENENQNVKFIHASSSKGVMISEIAEPYWKQTFAKAVRIIN